MNRNLTMMTDFYQLTMMQGYFKREFNQKVIFDGFYRINPSGNGYSIVAGLEQIMDYIKNLHFNEEDINYLKGLNMFDSDFLAYLKEFKFTGDIFAIPEGTVIFPMEPFIKVIAPIMEAQLIETALLNILNHQSLIATKAARICQAAKGGKVMEFGLRRAQGPDAGMFGSRAAMIGGCIGTSNVASGKEFQIPVMGTHAHSWIMSFDDELEAFRSYASIYPENILLLVDTYDTLHSGVPNAIKVFSELRDKGVKFKSFGIRLDSGDLAYLSKGSRKLLDEAGFKDAVVCASSDLDEYLITSLIDQGAKIDIWGVGTNLITSKDCPAFGGVYKLAGIYENDEIIPKIKLSENECKITNPGNKTVYRIYDKKDGMHRADLIALTGECFDCDKDLVVFDPVSTWKKICLRAGTYDIKELLIPVFVNGDCVYESPSVMNIRKYCESDLKTFWPETKRIVNPHITYVDLSENLWRLKHELLESLFIK